ncbi:MAG: DUF3883 domain-containing protein [Candidatus Jacksonbacteria bacterium]|jgi:hypothetical protein|nr:DUF3883 domain-containing protein [Candidatus Jacksonbacteria bacterium]MBT7008272.1 DUF3883 domain-containing protein [Candidatus Jacksonbacteria bacterium]
MYTTPQEFNTRLHHVRPRFKNDVESVLLFMATEINRLSEMPHEKFKTALNDSINLYPGNASKTKKTIDNWRTEISALFGLIEYTEKTSKPSTMANILAERQDLIEFFRYSLFNFQYPGGHLKPSETLELIKKGVKFKPAKYLLEVMMKGREIIGNDQNFGITKSEATHLIFNDLRVTKGNKTPEETARQIISNRDVGLSYDNKGDVVRYAGDILDYMQLADLVTLRPNYQYYPNTHNAEVIQAFIKDNSFFKKYTPLYNKKDLILEDIKATQNEWFHYVNSRLDPEIFKADVLSVIEEAADEADSIDQRKFIKQIIEKIRDTAGLKTKEIGDVGEALTIEHEKNRLTIANRQDLIHLVLKMPERLAVGYDINSREIDETHKYIEVKTTVSRGKLSGNNFSMSPNEWNSAKSNRKLYFVYRIMISSSDISLFVIQDPVGKERDDLLDMTPRNGADIRYNERSGNWEKLLV